MAPKTALNVCEPAPNSGVFVLPMITAPACRSRSHEQGVRGGDVVGEQRRPVGRPHSGRVLEVLDRDREPLERAGRRFVGRLERQLGVELRDDRVQERVHLLDPLEVALDDFARGELTGADRPRRVPSRIDPTRAGLY